MLITNSGRNRWAEKKRELQVVPPMNDDQSALTTLISCIECAKTMQIERIEPEGHGKDKDMIQYRCEHCGKKERVRLIRGTWPQTRQAV